MRILTETLAALDIRTPNSGDLRPVRPARWCRPGWVPQPGQVHGAKLHFDSLSEWAAPSGALTVAAVHATPSPTEMANYRGNDPHPDEPVSLANSRCRGLPMANYTGNGQRWGCRESSVTPSSLRSRDRSAMTFFCDSVLASLALLSSGHLLALVSAIHSSLDALAAALSRFWR